VGISLGGNALMRWAGEMGEAAAQVVQGVASVCSPIDLVAGGWAIGRGFNRLVYTRMFLQHHETQSHAQAGPAPRAV
jgi:predicted alpha/beta-fold hydrolase